MWPDPVFPADFIFFVQCQKAESVAFINYNYRKFTNIFPEREQTWHAIPNVIIFLNKKLFLEHTKNY